jgi:hypothetical protein
MMETRVNARVRETLAHVSSRKNQALSSPYLDARQRAGSIDETPAAGRTVDRPVSGAADSVESGSEAAGAGEAGAVVAPGRDRGIGPPADLGDWMFGLGGEAECSSADPVEGRSIRCWRERNTWSWMC